MREHWVRLQIGLVVLLTGAFPAAVQARTVAEAPPRGLALEMLGDTTYEAGEAYELRLVADNTSRRRINNRVLRVTLPTGFALDTRRADDPDVVEAKRVEVAAHAAYRAKRTNANLLSLARAQRRLRLVRTGVSIPARTSTDTAGLRLTTEGRAIAGRARLVVDVRMRQAGSATIGMNTIRVVLGRSAPGQEIAGRFRFAVLAPPSETMQ